MEYVPPFNFKLNEDGSLVKDQTESASPMLVLVFKQVVLEKFKNKRILISLGGPGLVRGNACWLRPTNC